VASRSRASTTTTDDEWVVVPPAPLAATPVPPAAAPEEVTPEEVTPQEAPAPEPPARETPAQEQAPAPPPAPAPPAPAAAATPALASAERGVTAVAPAPGAIEPFGPGSAAPRPDGSSPGPEYTIKGNAQSKMFHPPTSPYYGRTRAEVWFRTAADAEAAGFRPYRARTRG
jgi:hypothetical protein